MKHQWPIEKHAAALGVPGVKVTFATFNGPDATNDALLSGAVDIVSGGPPGLLDGALIQQIVDDPPNIYSVTPLASTKWTGFLYWVGRSKVNAASWKDLFWQEIWDLPGN